MPKQHGTPNATRTYSRSREEPRDLAVPGAGALPAHDRVRAPPRAQLRRGPSSRAAGRLARRHAGQTLLRFCEYLTWESDGGTVGVGRPFTLLQQIVLLLKFLALLHGLSELFGQPLVVLLEGRHSDCGVRERLPKLGNLVLQLFRQLFIL